jgi:DNA-binding Lrp family transcriptional regulator
MPPATHQLPQMPTIDALDARLLSVLAENARLGVVELSSRLGVSRNTVQARIRRLEDLGILRGFTPQVDLAAAGVPVQGFAALAIEQGKLNAVVLNLAGIPYVLEVHATTGQADLLVRVATTSHAELQELIQRIVALDGVSHANTSLTLTTPLAHRVQPLLNEVTQSSGFGRSTPRVDDN